MDKYYPLDKIHYMNNYKEHQKEYNNRFYSYATYKTNLYIRPIENGTFSDTTEELFIVNIPELSALNEAVLMNSKKIELLLKDMPKVSVQHFMTNLLINELQSTNEIEGIRSSKQEIAEVLESVQKKGDASKEKRFLGLAKLYAYLEESDNIKNVEDFRRIYDVLVSDEIKPCDVLDGELFRKGPVYIKGGSKTYHVGVVPEVKIVSGLARMISFLESSVPDLYKYAVVHYYFEYIHPFYDGNGRTGRYIMCSYLAKKLDYFSSITFSYMVNRNRNQYYKSFENTSKSLNKGEVTFFCIDTLTILKNGQEKIIANLEEKKELLHTISKNLNTLIKNDDERNVLFILAQAWLFEHKKYCISVAELTELFSFGRKRMDTILWKYSKLGYLEKIKSRPTIFTLEDSFAQTLKARQ
ncbi:Fic family protein [Listeria rustica]|uniref:Fic family protein n=1 Tax=Listeria rustica TaxID=2713503 RepID=A0A7W1YFM6_9LIST|nr:Fic family protein [Listeria rustica]MBA3925786.1 Fic family protein [Listeria rustica]